MQRKLCRWAAAIGAALATLLASCASDQSGRLHGSHLTVMAAWSGTEQADFTAVLQAFTRQTGVTVTYVSAQHGVPRMLDARLAAGDPPDVALLPQPGLLHRYARSGSLLRLDSATTRLVRSDYSTTWQSLATVDGALYGVWFKAANKSLLWYDGAALQHAGVTPPTELSGLVSAAVTLRADGVTPFAVGGRDQWTLTDWFENLYLQLAGPDQYDRLAAHQLPWTDSSVQNTLTFMSQLLAPAYIRGGTSGALNTGFEDSVAHAFSSPPGAAMVMEGDFVTSVIHARTTARVGVDVDVVPFPTTPQGSGALIGGGDVAVQLRASDAASALMRYLASPGAASIWASAGGFISPNHQLDPARYRDDLTRSIAGRLIAADAGFRFDLSDLQPAAFGATPNAGMQGALRDLLITHDVAGTARRLEQAAAAAYSGSR